MKVKIINKKLRSSKKLAHFAVAQGACSDGRYIYMAFERKHPQGIRIAKYTTKGKLIAVSKTLKVGHGNDMTCRGNTLYITHSGKGTKIHTVNKHTLKQGKNIKVIKPKKIKKKITGYNGIAKNGDGYVLRRMGGGLVFTDKNFKIKSFVKCDEPEKKSPQGIECNGKHIFRAYSNLQTGQNYYWKYSMTGKKIKSYKVSCPGELESIFFVGNKMRFGVYRKYKRKGKKVYKAYLVRPAKDKEVL